MWFCQQYIFQSLCPTSNTHQTRTRLAQKLLFFICNKHSSNLCFCSDGKNKGHCGEVMACEPWDEVVELTGHYWTCWGRWKITLGGRARIVVGELNWCVFAFLLFSFNVNLCYLGGCRVCWAIRKEFNQVCNPSMFDAHFGWLNLPKVLPRSTLVRQPKTSVFCLTLLSCGWVKLQAVQPLERPRSRLVVRGSELLVHAYFFVTTIRSHPFWPVFVSSSRDPIGV